MNGYTTSDIAFNVTARMTEEISFIISILKTDRGSNPKSLISRYISRDGALAKVERVVTLPIDARSPGLAVGAGSTRSHDGGLAPPSDDRAIAF